MHIHTELKFPLINKMLSCLFSGVLTLTLSGASLPTDGSGRILITDINPSRVNNADALTCHTGIGADRTDGNFFLHPTSQSTNDADSIQGTRDERGWNRRRDANGNRLVFLRRVSDTALEGMVTCSAAGDDEAGDDEAAISIGVYYPSESIINLNRSILPQWVFHRYYTYNIYDYSTAVSFAKTKVPNRKILFHKLQWS